MRVRVAESNLVQDLVDFLRRCGCEVDQTSAGVVDVRLQPGIGPEWARMEVDEYLRVWCVRHPGTGAAVLDRARPP